ncbi:hypothetical protein, partial [Streptomyces flavidovirens]
GTLLSSQGTDASFVLTLAGFPPGFRSVFRVSNPTRSVSRSVSGSEFVSGGRLEWPFAFRLVPDFIRSISAELIGFVIRI